MKHAREDYKRIQDPEGKIPEDEPVFLLRAQDKFAPIVVEFWADLMESNGGSEEIVASVRQQIKTMVEWQKTHKEKLADLPTN